MQARGRVDSKKLMEMAKAEFPDSASHTDLRALAAGRFSHLA